MQSDTTLNQFTAQQVIESLKSGIPNINSIFSINVDINARKLWFDDISKDMNGYIKNGGSKVRFINGRYGNGKTHILSMIKYESKKLNYVVSYVSAECVKLSRYDELYREIIKNLETKDRQENVFKFLIENYVIGIKKRLEHEYDDEEDQMGFSKELKRRIKEFTGKLTKSSANFQSALKHYMVNFIEAPTQKDWESENETILRWFNGEKIPLKDLRPFQIYALNDKDNARESIKALSDILKIMGFSGIIVLIDEAERILTQSKTVAQTAYNNIRHLLDSVDGGGEINHAESCYIFIASTPEMLNEKNGYQSYTALYDRIKPGLAAKSFSKDLINPRAIIVDLENDNAQVKVEDLEKIINKIITIHSIAYEWEPEKIIKEGTVSQIAKRAYDYSEQKAPLRATVEMMVEMLDIGQNNNEYLKNFNPKDYSFKPDNVTSSLWD